MKKRTLVNADGSPVPKKEPPKVVTGKTLLEEMTKPMEPQPAEEVPIPENVHDTKPVYVPDDRE